MGKEQVITPASEAKDIIQETQERLFTKLTDCGNNFFQTLQRNKDFVRIPRGQFRTQVRVGEMLVSTKFSGRDWSAILTSNPDSRDIPLPQSVHWLVDAGQQRRGPFQQTGIALWEQYFEVRLGHLDGLPHRSLELRAWNGRWEIRSSDSVNVEPTIKFGEHMLTEIDEEAFCLAYSDKRNYRQPLSISRGWKDPAKVTVTYARRSRNGKLVDEREVRPYGVRLESELKTAFASEEREDQSPEDLYQDFLFGHDRASDFIQQLLSSFPRQVDFVNFLEREVAEIMGRTDQALSALQNNL